MFLCFIFDRPAAVLPRWALLLPSPFFTVVYNRRRPDHDGVYYYPAEVQIDFPAASCLALSNTHKLMGLHCTKLALLFHISPELEALPTAASTAISSSGTRLSSSTDIATGIFIARQLSGSAHWTKNETEY